MSKHTPGPWTICYYNRSILEEHRSRDGCSVVIAKLPDIAGPEHEPESYRPNANLIAAAPDMLEALRVLVGFAEAHNGETYVKEHLKIARTAITKAEGK